MPIIWTNKNPERSVLKRSTTAQVKMGPVSVKFITILIIAILSIFYLFQSNASATKAYEVKDLEDKKEDLVAENERLFYEAERLKSLTQVEKEAKDEKMEEIESIDATAK